MPCRGPHDARFQAAACRADFHRLYFLHRLWRTTHLHGAGHGATEPVTRSAGLGGVGRDDRHDPGHLALPGADEAPWRAQPVPDSGRTVRGVEHRDRLCHHQHPAADRAPGGRHLCGAGVCLCGVHAGPLAQPGPFVRVDAVAANPRVLAVFRSVAVAGRAEWHGNRLVRVWPVVLADLRRQPGAAASPRGVAGQWRSLACPGWFGAHRAHCVGGHAVHADRHLLRMGLH
ncbi:hypothetical protein D3C79_604650 [compost metagenome]